MDSAIRLSRGPAIGAWEANDAGITADFASMAVNAGRGAYEGTQLDPGESRNVLSAAKPSEKHWDAYLTCA